MKTYKCAMPVVTNTIVTNTIANIAVNRVASRIIKSGIVLSVMALSVNASAAEITVADGYSPLAMKAVVETVSSDFNNTADLNGISGYRESGDATPCNGGEYDGESCMASFGVTHIDLAADDKALSITGANLAPTFFVYGELPDYGSEIALEKFAFVNGLIPGAVSGDTGEPSALHLPADAGSFNMSVDLKSSANPLDQDYRHGVGLGSVRLMLRRPETGADTLTFYTPTSVVGSETSYEVEETPAPDFASGIPEDTWLTYSVVYNSVTRELTHTLRSRDDGGLTLNETVTVFNVYPKLIVDAMSALVDVVAWTENDDYGSVLELDNYANDQKHIHYTINKSPLVYDNGSGPEAYIEAEDITYFLGPFSDIGNGMIQPAYMLPIGEDDFRLPPSVTGHAGNNYNIGLALIPNGEGGFRKVNGVSRGSLSDFETFITAGGGTPIKYYPDVYIADGQGRDFILEKVCGATPLFLLTLGSLGGWIRRRR